MQPYSHNFHSISLSYISVLLLQSLLIQKSSTGMIQLQNSCILFYQNFQKRENPYADKGFFSALQRRNFLSLRRVKCSSYCRHNFFLAIECHISLFPLFPYYIYRKINERFRAGHRSDGQSGHKIRLLRKKFGPFC